MGLSNSLFAGISGLDREQTRLDVIGNNLANVNTYGFKQQRVLFEDILYNTIRSGTAPDSDRGGTNPSQIGAGVDIAQITTNFNQGDFETTGIDSDLAIEGNGFFVIRDGASVLYTREGAFTLNQERKLINAATGMVVQGWNQTRDNNGNSSVNSGGATTDVLIPIGDNRIAKATTKIDFNGNLNNQGVVGTTGTIFSSQKLFSSSSGDTEVSSGAFDLSKVYIKDPAGGSDNVLLFKGSGSTTTANNVLTSGDQIRVQLMKGGRPLEAIFTYGNSDQFDNVTGVKKPDGVADAGLEHYDGTTINDFLRWFDYAFGLKAVENTGASTSTNAANGLDGDNPNDLVDMGLNAGDPFKDETDSSGFELGLSSKGAESISGNTATSTTGPKAAMLDSSRTFNIIAGSASDIGTSASYVDLDEDSAFNKEKDLVLEGTTSYVVTGNSTVTAGAQAYGSTSQLALRTIVPLSQQGGPIPNASDVFIDTDGDGVFDGGETIVKGAWSSDVFGSDTATAANQLIAASAADNSDGVLEVTFDTAASATNNNDILSLTTVTKGMTIYAGNNTVAGTTRYTVTKVALNTTTGILTVTFDKANGTAPNAITTTSQDNSSFVFEGAALVTAGYTATSASGFGSTLVTAMNVPISRLNSNSKYQGRSISNTMVDNEKGKAGSTFISGDVKAVVTSKPTAYLTASALVSTSDPNGKGTITITGTVSSLALRVGMTTYVGSTKYTIDKLVDDGTTTTVTFDKAPTSDTIASGQNVEFSGFAILDANGDGSLNETVFRVRNDRADTASAVTGNLYIDLDHDGVKDTADLVIETTSTKDSLASFSDNEVVYKDTSGNVYRKVPSQFDPDSRLIYLDVQNKGTLDEVRYNLINTAHKASVTATAVANAVANDGFLELTMSAADVAKLNLGMTYSLGSRVYTITAIPTTTTVTIKASDTSEATANVPTTSTINFYQSNMWCLDEDFDGKADGPETNYVSVKDMSQTIVGETISLDMPSAVSINGLSTGASRIQLRGNIGTVNNLSQINFISGADVTERNIFAGSTLADTTGAGFKLLASATGESVVQNIVIYDSLGRSHDVAMTFVLENKDNDKAEWRWYAETADATQANGSFPVTDPRGKAPSINVGTGKVIFDNFGRFLRSEPAQPLISIPLEGMDTDSALNIIPNFATITSFADATGSEVDVREQDGYAAGVMDRFSVNQDGSVTGIYTNGMREVVSQVALAAFANPSGLIRSGNNIFKVGANSGNAMIGAALTGERGAIRSKALEQSNVDITTEFTNMIITQRAYQANARLITKSDEMLQELMSIIR